MLPDREKETLENWSKQQPSIQKVTRDRFIRFQEVLDNIPSITQIHDRFYLIQNLWGVHDKAVRKILPNRIEKNEKTIQRNYIIFLNLPKTFLKGPSNYHIMILGYSFYTLSTKNRLLLTYYKNPYQCNPH